MSTTQFDKESVAKEVHAVIAKIMEIDESSIRGDANLVEDLGADSMRIIEIMVALDKKYKINIQESDLPKMTSANQILSIVLSEIQDK